MQSTKCIRVSTLFALPIIILLVYYTMSYNSQETGYNGFPLPKQEKADTFPSINLYRNLVFSHSMSHLKSRSRVISVKQSTAFSTVKNSKTNVGRLRQQRSIGKNGLLNISDNCCCLKSAGKSLEELCTVDYTKTLLNLRQVDSEAKLKLKNISVSTENEQTSDGDCACEDFMYCKLVVVTGFSSNHFREAQGMIASVQEHLPNTKLIVYDLGLTEGEISSVRKYCNVELRKFDYSQYPEHVSTLITYAFKPLIVKEVTQEYEVVLWGDASVRMMAHLPDLFRFLTEFPYVSGPRSTHASISLTHDSMLKYLNITQSRNALSSHLTFQGGTFLIWANTFLKQHLLQYWIDCAIHPECISPPGAGRGGCDFSKEKEGAFIGCHRFDQSALNMIMTREFGLGIDKVVYHEEIKRVLTFQRHSASHSAGPSPRMCY